MGRPGSSRRPTPVPCAQDRSGKFVPSWVRGWQSRVKAQAEVDPDTVFGPIPRSHRSCFLSGVQVEKMETNCGAKKTAQYPRPVSTVPCKLRVGQRRALSFRLRCVPGRCGRFRSEGSSGSAEEAGEVVRVSWTPLVSLYNF